MIIQGSNNVPLNVSVINNGRPASLSGATASIVIKAGIRRFTKQATIVSDGLVTSTLTSDDLSSAGTYFVQVIVTYTSGGMFISEENSFPVGASL